MYGNYNYIENKVIYFVITISNQSIYNVWSVFFCINYKNFDLTKPINSLQCFSDTILITVTLINQIGAKCLRI